LVPGVYIVKADLAGFRSAAQENVVVNADVTARVDLKLEIGALSEGVTVTGQSPLLDTTSALKQTVLSREVLDSLPNRIDVWSVARVIPSVVLSKVDVGGSESFLQSTATVHGSNNENGFLIDGMDVSNLDGNGTGAVLYLDPYAFQETNYQTSGGGTAVSSKCGLLFNMVTRTGTNQLHGGAMFSGANRGMGSANYSGDVRTQLLAGIPDLARAANPNIVPGADILKIYDVGAWLAGPVVRDRIWFSFSAHDQRLDQYLLGNYNPDGTQVLDDNLMWTTAATVAWQVPRQRDVQGSGPHEHRLLHRTPRHQVRLSVHRRRREVVELVDVGDARRVSQRPSRFGQHLQRADHVDVDEDSRRLRTMGPRSRRLHPGQVDADEEADTESGIALRNDVRLAAR